MLETIRIRSISDLPSAAEKIISLAGNKKVVAFYGEMGSGKTTLIKSICKLLGVNETTSSPTFSIVNEYVSAKAGKIYHFDFYRLKKEAEAMDIGCEEYFSSGNYCFVEWPERIPNLLPADTVNIRIAIKDDIREFSIT